MTEREVVDLVKEWKDELKKVIQQYNTGLKQLDNAVALVNASKVKWWVIYKIPIITLVTIAAFVGGILSIAVIMKNTDMCLVNVGQKETSLSVKSCEEVRKADTGSASVKSKP